MKDPGFRFADLLEKDQEYTPVRHHQPPFWDPSRAEGGIAPALRSIFRVAHLPTLNWGPKDVDGAVAEGTLIQPVDANGAFVAAASSATFAHCALEHTGQLVNLERGAIPPGYLLVDVHAWQGGAPGSPLGANRPRGAQIWVPHTTYAVLRDLTYGASWCPGGGFWPDATVYDSYTADPVRFYDWACVVRDTRANFKQVGDTVNVERIKTAYSQAVQMWDTPPDKPGTPPDKRHKKNKAYRPDWYAALRGQHAANMWRVAFQCALAGHPPLRVYDTDRLVFTADDLAALLHRAKPPIRMDDTGIGLGTFKRLDAWYAGIEGL